MNTLEKLANRFAVPASSIAALGEPLIEQLHAHFSDNGVYDDHEMRLERLKLRPSRHGLFGLDGSRPRDRAYQITVIDGRCCEPDAGIPIRYLSLPLLIDGAAWSLSHDEFGGGGVLCLCRLPARGSRPESYHVSGHPRGWVYVEELPLSAGEVSQRIVDEADDGLTPLSRPPAGWA